MNSEIDLIKELTIPGVQYTLDARYGAALYDTIDVTAYIYYIVPWLFPLLAIISNPAVFKAGRSLCMPGEGARCKLKMRVTVGTVIENPVAESTLL